MHILFLSELLHPHGSGAELATFLYAKLLSEAGYDVSVVTNRYEGEPEESSADSFKIYRLKLLDKGDTTKYSLMKSSYVLATGFLRKMIKWSDLVYVPRFWFSAIPIAKAYGKPVVTHLHDYIPVCPLSTLYDQSKGGECHHGRMSCDSGCIYAFEKTRNRSFVKTAASLALNLSLGRILPKTVNLSDAIICVSNVQRNLIAERESSIRYKMHVVYNPISESPDIDIGGKDFGYFGGCDYMKGFCVLCRALALHKTSSSYPTRIHATKLSRDNLCFSRSLSRLGFLLYDRLDENEFRRVYRQVQTVLVPSIWNEPWPYVVVEALLRRRLLIASNIGGIPEQVEGCRGVFLCKPGNKENLADNMEIVAGLSKEEAEELGWQNREAFLSRFNNESSIRKFISICDRLT